MAFKLKLFARSLLFPLLLSLVYLAQIHFPGLFKQGALWSAHPRWWQFFTNGFLSGNSVHLLINSLGMYFICYRFVPHMKALFVLMYFVLFSAAASFLYFSFCMPPHATLVGASGGAYSLLGFMCWFLRGERFEFIGKVPFLPPVLPTMGFVLLLEFLAARFWIPVLAWELHVIAFGVSLVAALGVHSVYAATRWLASRESRAGLIHSTCAWGFSVLSKAKEAVIVPSPGLSLD